jgi:2,4-dienoyl-CoA reductase-like NADH-dependent reductase (Old Yellow Enzyme family)
VLEPFAFARGITLRNRMVMAPMTTWSSHDDGTVSDEELPYACGLRSGIGSPMFIVEGVASWWPR